MRHFDFKNGDMFAEDVALKDIADEVGTPCYVYSTATFERHYNVFADSFAGIRALVAYSVKANSNIAILATLAKLGAGADVVSGGELARALTAGIPGRKIVFSGVGKTAPEMRAALLANIKVFNVESLAELYVLNANRNNENYVSYRDTREWNSLFGAHLPSDIVARVAGLRFAASELERTCLLYTSPSPRDGLLSRMPSSA